MQNKLTMNINDLLNKMDSKGTTSADPEYMTLQSFILVRCTEMIDKQLNTLSSKIESLNKSIEDSTKTNEKLNQKIIILNSRIYIATWVGVVATIIGTIIAFITFKIS